MLDRLFRFLARSSTRYPLLVVGIGIALAFDGVVLTSQLKMYTSRLDLLSPKNPHLRNYNSFTHEFGTANNVYFIIEGPTLEQSKRCADALAAEISRQPRYIRDVLYRFDLQFIKRKLFLYLPPEQLHQLDEYLREESGLLAELVAAENLNALFSATAKLAEKRAREGFKNPATPVELAALATLLESINAHLWEGKHEGMELLPSVISGALPFGVLDDPEGYLVGKNGLAVILMARPNAEREDSSDFLGPMMASLIEARDNVLRKFPDVSIGMTGLPTFAYGDLQVMENEIPRLSLMALIAVVLIFLLSFGRLWEVAFAGASILLAVAWTLGATTVTIGHLNIVSSVFAMTMVGLGIDFGIHFITRYDVETAKGGAPEDVMQRALLGCGMPIATGALTTAAAFYVFGVTEFKGLAELGIIAGTGILFSLISMLTILPSLMSLRFRAKHLVSGTEKVREPFLSRALSRLAVSVRNHAGAVLATSMLATLILCYFAPRVEFDYNFLHIQPVTSTSARYEETLMERTGLAPSFNVIVKNDLVSLHDACTKLRGMPSVSRVDSASTLVPLDQQQKLPIVRRIIQQVEELKNKMGTHHGRPDVTELVSQYEEMQEGLETALKAKALVGNEHILSEIERCSRAANLFLDKYKNAERNTVEAQLAAFSENFFSYLDEQMEVLGSDRQLQPVTFADLPENIRTRVVGKTGKYAAYVFPSQSIWNKAFLDRFNADVLSVAPDAAGTALFAQSMLDIAGRTLRQCSLLVTAAVIILVFLHFRKVLLTLLALLSVTVGVIWMLGIMHLVGWQYNPINMMAVPLMLGIGIDSGIHIVHRFCENGYDIRNTLSTSGLAITVSALTTIAGFACLLFSTHRGLVDLGQLMVLGASACLIASLVVLPAILSLLASAGIKM